MIFVLGTEDTPKMSFTASYLGESVEDSNQGPARSYYDMSLYTGGVQLLESRFTIRGCAAGISSLCLAMGYKPYEIAEITPN